MKIPKICSNQRCRNPFIAIKATQQWCSRSCFKKSYYLRQKAELEKEERRTKRYQFNCEICGNSSDIGGNVIKSPQLLTRHICPWCGIPRQALWEHRYDTTFLFGTGTVQYVISSAIVSGTTVIAESSVQDVRY